MSDLSTFRIVRSPQSRAIDAADVYRPLDPAAAPLPLVQALYAPPPTKGSNAANPMKVAEQFVQDRRQFVDPDLPSGAPDGSAAIIDGLRSLDTWLSGALNRPDGADFDVQLRELGLTAADGGPATTIASDGWLAARSALCQSLASALILARPANPASMARYATVAGKLSRRLLVAGAVEWRAGQPGSPTADAIYRVLHDRSLVLHRPDSSNAQDRRGLVRAPGFADLYVVRSEWSCYLPGEISHIDNVMEGELRRRVHVRLDETDTTQTVDAYSDTTEERDTQSTDRFTLDAQADSETNLKLAIAASVDTSGQYGPTHVNTHVGGSFDFSDDESRKLATSQAHEIIAKAVSKVEQSVRNVQTTRTLNRIRERNVHSYDATHVDHHIVGVFRWVDKIERMQLFRYRHRYLLEFEIPEPSAWYVWASEHATVTAATGPLPFTQDGTTGTSMLTLADVTAGSYAVLAGRYGASNLSPPPAEEKTVETSFTLEADPPDYNSIGETDIDLRAAPGITKTVQLGLPDGYESFAAEASAVAAPAHARWGDALNAARQFEWEWGYHHKRVDVSIGNQVIVLQDASPATVRNATEFGDAWLSAHNAGVEPLSPISGQVTIGATAGGSYRVTVSVSVRCRATGELRAQWAADTYSKIRAAYDAANQAYQDTAASMFGAATGLGAADSPDFNARVVQEELKRQVVELLLGEPFAGYDAVVTSEDATTGPRLDPDRLVAAAPYIQMMEQAFEWENITYVCYPYFWADQSRWTELAARRSADPDFQNFLRAGSVRVVVPARPGFEDVVNAYLDYGVIWGGGPAPSPGDPDYLSISDEIRAMQQGPDDGEPGDSWEVRLPTTLVWLDNDSSIPKVNPARTLAAPAEPMCPDPASAGG